MARSRIFLSALLLLGAAAHAVVPEQIDTFEDGTTQGWVAAILGAPHPAPPVNQPGGGPGGDDDSYLQVTSFGGDGPGSKLVAINPAQWGGDYPASGVGAIAADLKNLGGTDLVIRFLLEDPGANPPVNIAVTQAVFLPAGSGWTHAEFSLDPADLVAVQGTVAGALAGATTIRVFHNPDPTFPPPAIAAQLGVDNVRAVPAEVAAESATLGAVKAGYR